MAIVSVVLSAVTLAGILGVIGLLYFAGKSDGHPMEIPRDRN